MCLYVSSFNRFSSTCHAEISDVHERETVLEDAAEKPVVSNVSSWIVIGVSDCYASCHLQFINEAHVIYSVNLPSAFLRKPVC